MTHICNDCKFNDVCKDKFIEKSGMLCNNIFFQKQREIEWRQQYEQENNSI